MIFLQSGMRDKEYDLAMQNLFAFTIVGKNKHDDFPDVCAMTMTVMIPNNQIISVKQRRF